MRIDDLIYFLLESLLALFRRHNEELALVLPNIEAQKVKAIFNVSYLRLLF